MSMRLLCLLLSSFLLASCVHEPPPSKSVPAVSKPTAPAPATPANLRTLSGSLATPPAGSEVELALLVIDERDRPQRLLGNLTLAGTGQPLPFALTFNPEVFPADARVELRARVNQSGLLIQHLQPRTIRQAQNQSLGELQLDAAP
ncbi:YbaY family lipoprotein [Pseudomonas sp. RIT-PI-AD]|uniref:YbaY family lipoprotein n=1 Tax=Pseudomonas sp. RIT-PI-AD TaxID=3035294 RepID=UPI0021D7DE44|nr:YbaY family lipoprotein [Pseudomonas sp. RIT-PI-AD]